MLFGWPRLRGLSIDEHPYPLVDRVVCSFWMQEWFDLQWRYNTVRFLWLILLQAQNDKATEATFFRPADGESKGRSFYRGDYGDNELAPYPGFLFEMAGQCVLERGTSQSCEHGVHYGKIKVLDGGNPHVYGADWLFCWNPQLGELHFTLIPGSLRPPPNGQAPGQTNKTGV